MVIKEIKDYNEYMLKNKEKKECFCDYSPLVARVFIAITFFVSALGKVLVFDDFVIYATNYGLPFPAIAIIIAAAIEILGGISILIGYKIKIGAGALVFFSLVTALIFHSNFADQIQMSLFMKNLALAGGLLYVAYFGAGKVSVDEKLEKRKTKNS